MHDLSKNHYYKKLFYKQANFSGNQLSKFVLFKEKLVSI